MSGVAGIGLAILVVGVPAPGAAEVAVDSPEALAQALREAGPGTVIRLEAGDYGALNVRGLSGGPDAPVVLRSADPADRASFSRLHLRDVAHLDLRGLVFDYTFAPGDEGRLQPFHVRNSRDVEISGSLFDGDEVDGFPTAFGLGVRWVEGFTLDESEVRGFYRGLVVSESSDVTVRGTDLHAIRMDGMNFAQVSRVLIEGNHIHDFDRAVDSGDHADMIQFWTNRTSAPSTDVTIRGNLLNSGAGWYTQSIFMRNEVVDSQGAGPEMFYRNVRIEDNVILNAHLHGITLGATDGLVIANNSVLRNAASEGPDGNPGLWTPMITVAGNATDVRILRNVTFRIVGFEGQGGWDVADNLLAQDRAPSAPGFYGRLFAAMPAGNPRDPRSFAPRPGGALDGTGLGAPMLAGLGN